MVTRRKFIKNSTLTMVSLAVAPVFSGFGEVSKNEDQNVQYDAVIIGGSYAGLACALTLARAQRTVLVIDSGAPCNRYASFSHNFLTQDGIPPAQIAAVAKEQILKYPNVKILSGLAVQAKKAEDRFVVDVEEGKSFYGKKLVIATGVTDIMPAIPGFSECWGLSILHCPYCHGYEVRNLPTGILANGDGAFEMAKLLSNWTDDLTVFTNGVSTLTLDQAKKLEEKNIHVIEKEVASLKHRQGQIEDVVFKDNSSFGLRVLYNRPSFKQHSNIPELLGCSMTDNGIITVDTEHRTNVSGVYACGDSMAKIRSVTFAVSSGNTVGLMLNKELIDEQF